MSPRGCHTIWWNLCSRRKMTGKRFDMVVGRGNEVAPRGVDGALTGRIAMAACVLGRRKTV